MILDTSALLAVLLGEPEAANYAGAAIYVDRNGDAVLRAMLDTFLGEFSIRTEAVTADQALLARQGFVLFGKDHHKVGILGTPIRRRRDLKRSEFSPEEKALFRLNRRPLR